MFLKSLILKNFRNYSSLNVAFSKGINLIVGDNGMGKTNLLEAINLLSTGRSFKTAKLEDLIQDGKSHFFLEATFVKEDVTQTLKIGYDRKTKVIEYNSTKLEAFSHILGIIPSTLYCPKDLNLIAGAPTDRRRFLNVLLAQNDPLYVHHLFRYMRALKHRNALLKVKKLAGIDSFENEMILSGIYLAKTREKTLCELEELLKPLLKTFSQNSESYSVKYLSSINLKTQNLQKKYKEELARLRPKELLLKATLFGPHRDDVGIFHNEKLAKQFASEGQKRSFVAALKCCEWQLLQKQHSKKPLMCIDDFGVHLDDQRKQHFEDLLEGFGQVFITMPKNTLKLNPDKTYLVKSGDLNLV